MRKRNKERKRERSRRQDDEVGIRLETTPS